jgi:acyl transferase domain-containing protein/NAD(P)-dependent dehydrogenase (short-subunit alcohol dehydrogenase family)/acyl carrier protein
MDRTLDIAIVGVGCLFPKASGKDAYWANILKGVDAIREVPSTHWNAADYLNPDPKKPDHVYTARGGFLDPVDFDALEFGISPNNLEATDASQLLALAAVQQALADAGYGPGGRTFDRKRTSVLLGVTGTLQLVIPLGARLGHPIWRKALKDAGVDAETAEDVVARISDGYVPWQENSFPGLLGNVVAGRIANRFDFGGSNCVVDAACASSLAAIHLAAMELDSGRADMVVTGGVDAFSDIFMYMCFSKTPALSPTGDAKPFDQNGDGTILGEGLGIVLLKRRADAERDGDAIYAVLKGIGTSSDGRGNAIYAPTAKGQRECLKSAYSAADVSPATIELVEAHGTGTRVGDGVEVSALTEVYSESGRGGRWCALGSVKSQIGHTKAAAGAAGLVKAAIALHKKVLPPTIKVKNPLEPLSEEKTPFYVNAEPRPWLPSADHPRRAGVSSFGFGGSNFHAVLEEHSPAKADVDWDEDVLLVAFSALSRDVLQRKVSGWADGVSINDWVALRHSTAELRREFRGSDQFRITAVIERGRTPEQTIAELRRLAAVEGSSEHPSGVFSANGNASGQLAFLFPGQGSQYVGMLRDLACRFPEMQTAFAEAEAEIRRTEPGADRLGDVVYPPSSFNDPAKSENDRRLRSTEWAQPALGAAAAGLIAALERFDLRADMFAGHSYGELAALYAAKSYDSATLHRLSRFRGKAMAGRAAGGAMLAVSASIEDVQRFLDESKSSLVVANRNAPNQFVLSGAAAEIDAANETLSARNIRTHRLNVAAAFHSPLVAGAAGEFGAELAKATFVNPAKPVYANTTAKVYNGMEDGRSLLANQLAKPVEFVDLIRNMHTAGVRTYVEVGPSGKLVGLVRSILDDAPHQTAAVDPSNGQRSGMADFARVLAKCAALGHRVDLAKWDPDPPTPKLPKSKSTVSLLGINYVSPKTSRPPRVAAAKPVKVETQPILQPTKPTAAASEPAIIAQAPVRGTPKMQPPAVSHSPPALNGDLLRDGILALQRSQQQTAELHRQFLEHQTFAQQSLLALLGQTPVATASPLPVPMQPAAAAPVALPPPSRVPPRTVIAPPSPAQPRAEAPKQVVVPQVEVRSTKQSVVGPDVGELLLEVVADKTGYPREMLNLDMGLDADLGIDSIKRVEILSAVQEKSPGLKKIAADELGTLRTLRDVVAVMGVTTEAAPSAPLASPKPGKAAEILLAVVAEKTGYPSEMLNLDMGLDADLGIDSIKRVEILSAVQERLPQSRKIAADELGALRTLADVAIALEPQSTNVSNPKADTASKAVGLSDSRPVADVALGDLLLKIVADKTGYPVEMLHLDMGLDADLGIDSIKRVEILSSLQEAAPQLPKLAADQMGAIRTLGDIVSLLDGGIAQPAMPSQNARPSAVIPHVPTSQQLDVYVPDLTPLAAENRRRVSLTAHSSVWIVGAVSDRRDRLADALRRRDLNAVALTVEQTTQRDDAAAVSGLIYVANSADPLDDPESALAVMQRCSASLRTAGAKGHALLGALVEIDGGFGFGGESMINEPVRQAALLGLVKTARFEWPGVACKIIDADSAADADDLAEELLTEGPIEVAWNGGRRLEISLTPFTPSSVQPTLRRGELVVVSGGARGVTAAAAREMAARFGMTLAFLGRSELADEPAWLAGAAMEADIKRALLANASDKPSPKELNDRCRRVLAEREIRSNLDAVAKSGGRAVYRSCEVRDAGQVRRVVEELRREFGPVRGLIHGAGVLADKFIVDKTAADYEAVFSTKVEGAENLLNAVSDDELRFLAFFSSSTARFGRTGQCDYAAANEVLNKIAQRERRRRQECRVVSVNWGPWDGGMVDARLKALFAEEGVAVIPQAAGASLLADLSAGGLGDPVEVVVLGVGSRTPESTLRAKAVESANADLSFAFDRVVDAATHPVLRSHVIKNKAVLPAALMLEWAAHAAMLRNPGLSVAGAAEFQVLSGIKLAEGEQASLSFWSGRPAKTADGFRIAVEVRSDRNGKAAVNARGFILLANRLEQPSQKPTIQTDGGEGVDVEAAYSELLFHGPMMRAFAQIDSVGESTASASLAAPPDATEWFERPIRSRWLTPPLAIDAAFQLAILWSRTQSGSACLPTKIGRFTQSAGPMEAGARLVARFHQTSDGACTGDFEFIDGRGLVVAKLERCEFVVDKSLNEAFRLRECSAGS